MSTTYPVLHALLRDGVEWDAAPRGLVSAPDGALTLLRLPAPRPGAGVRLGPPFDATPSGIAVDGDGRVYSSDTRGHRLLVDVPQCDWRYGLPPHAGSVAPHGSLHTPAGVAVGGAMLYVADSGGHCVLGFVLPGVELARRLDAGLSTPTGVAVDRERRLYVVDRGSKRVTRFQADGLRDTAYHAAMAGHAQLADPAFIALAAEGTLIVSDATSAALLAFDEAGHLLGSFSAATPAGMRPGALATWRDFLFAADAATGSIHVFEIARRRFVGSVPGFHGPVAAMGCDAAGNLFVKTDSGCGHVRLDAAEGCVARGVIEAGPLDAGVDNDWERISLDIDSGAAGTVTLETYAGATTDPPGDADWTSNPGSDALLARESGPPTPVAATRRYLWVRATVESLDGRYSPTLRQVHAQTIGSSYLDLLPRIYRRDDQPTRFLERFLALGRGQMEDWDAELDALFRRFDPATAPVEALGWLAQSVALPLPHGLDPGAQRALIARLPGWYARRGTIGGVAEVAEAASGMRPHIFEAFQARRVWQLDAAPLGFDTALAASAPEGLVVPGQTPTDPAFIGLRRDEYAGLNFERHVDTTTERTLTFNPYHVMPLPPPGLEPAGFSVRWSGQIRAAYSETYTFYVTPARGIQLWVDGRPLIDSWTGQVEPGPARITLDAGRWYPITLELHGIGFHPMAQLEWSSRSQRRDVVPATALYSLLDEHADPGAAPAAVVDVGNAVVGATGPLAPADFGAPLFDDYAHLFTVVVAGARCGEAHQRQALRDAIDQEKPAHTDYHLCFAEARMRVGYQARLGVDAIVAEGPPPLRLGETALGRDSHLAGAPPGVARVGSAARVGRDTVVS